MSLSLIPYEVLMQVIQFLSHQDLMILRLVSREFTPWCNVVLFDGMVLNERHRVNPSLLRRFGSLVNRLTILGLDKASASYPQITKNCNNLKEVHIMHSEVDRKTIKSFKKYSNLRVFKAGLSAHRHLSSDISMWNQLDSLKKLTTLHLYDIDHRIAEHLFYSLPQLQDFCVKLISEKSNCMVSKSFKKTYLNPNLKNVHIESWVKEVEIDQVILLHPECLPNLTSLKLVSYQCPTQSWFKNKWLSLKNVQLDFVSSDQQVEYLMTNIPNVNSFSCIMWRSTGKLLNQLLFQLSNIRSLRIESSISKDVLQDLSPAPKVINLQIGILQFDSGALSMLHLIFPNVTNIHLGHCKPNPEIVESILSPQFDSLNLAWKSLSVFQLNTVIAAIVSRAPGLSRVIYEMASKQCDGVKFKKLAQSPSVKISRKLSLCSI